MDLFFKNGSYIKSIDAEKSIRNKGEHWTEYEIRKVYDRFYDDQSKQPNANLLGTFQVIEQIEEDGWDEMFIGRNVDTGEVCLIRDREVSFVDSGTAYTIFPLNHLCAKD